MSSRIRADLRPSDGPLLGLCDELLLLWLQLLQGGSSGCGIGLGRRLRCLHLASRRGRRGCLRHAPHCLVYLGGSKAFLLQEVSLRRLGRTPHLPGHEALMMQAKI
jgi:hypothetical protein